MHKYFSTIMEYITNQYSNESLLIAISGGQDSICLVKLMNNFDLKEKKCKQIDYIHIDHQWTKESKKQAEYIISYLKSLRKKVSIYQIKKTSLSEKISRLYRYHIIINHAIRYKYRIVLTAHTKTDKIETFFLNLIRGTTTEGTTALNLCRMIGHKTMLGRPLIYMDRQFTKFICRKYFLPLWSDNSNYNYSIKRNRVRNELIPYLRKYYNKKIDNNVLNFLNNCKYNNEYIKQKIIKTYLQHKHDKYVALNHKCLKKQHIIMQVKIIQFFLYHSINLFINKSRLISFINQLKKVKDKKCFTLVSNNISILGTNQWIYLRYHNISILNN
uniref:tRNA(Ile)-lysidine synthase, chloroplastic n=1 Tax=Platysiphonia delicata TaxID=2006979 RepID=A0A1Z1M0F1_9FLOR|nr:tRNA Ile-lysidine synthetase [Platysiphonia delicata]ARW59529.1 tRNA Ile-lysidine synthetase [Platysiphonia delicata]